MHVANSPVEPNRTAVLRIIMSSLGSLFSKARLILGNRTTPQAAGSTAIPLRTFTPAV
jgi:hypothetical protein